MLVNIFVKKIGVTVPLGEFSKLPQVTQDAIIQYGATQMCNDRHASITKGGETPFKGTDKEFHSAVMVEVNEWIAKAKAGTLSVRGTSDPKATARAFLLAQGYTEAQVDAMVAGPAPRRRAGA